MDLVCGVRVPNDQLAVLGRRNQVPAIRRPVHCVYFRQVALEGAFGLHLQPRELLNP